MDEAKPRQLGITLLWAAIGVAAIVLVVLLALALRGGPRITKVEPGPGEWTPGTALLTSTKRPVVVVGYVFWREGLPATLCEGSYSTNPPNCYGPLLNIEGFDINRLDLERGKDGPTDVAWSKEPVRFRGTLRTAHFDVTEVLS
ncbi:MAG TPA: hypothetical protein VMY88_01425 [Acidimicrobiales bacterium]|nr:hypothetical protein [Acidimicrobiales bacterium]